MLLVLPGILATATSLPVGADSWLMRLTPTTAFAIQTTLPRSNLATGAYTAVNGNFSIGPWAVLAVLAACTAVALGAAGAATHARWRPRPLRHHVAKEGYETNGSKEGAVA